MPLLASTAIEGANRRRKSGRGERGSEVGGRRHMAHLLDDGYLWCPHAPVKVGLGPEKKLLLRNGSSHGEE